MKRSAMILLLISSSIVALASGCTKEDSGGDDTDNSNSTNNSVAAPTNLRTSCGTVFEGQLVNPAKPKEAKRGSLRYVGPNLVAIKTKKGEQLVKLHGLDVPTSEQQKAGAEKLLTKLSAEGDGYFYIAEPDCTVILDDGTEGAVGHLFSAKGKSFSEQLIKSGNAQVASDVCQGSLISSCYRALEEESAPPTPTAAPEPDFSGPANAKGFILWKPVSDSNGKLAVHSVPYGSSIRVAGETGRNQGGGNGYGSLARFSKAGCSYGKNVKLELILGDGTTFDFGSKGYATIPDGCKRYLIDKKGVAKLDNK